MIKERRITLKNAGKIDPEKISDYIRTGGYRALEKALQQSPAAIIGEMLQSSLRGRGGAGFSTGLKEKFTSEASKTPEERFLVCNADEGEPGTFKDRIIMEKDPHRVIEGILIAAYSIGATRAFIYIRGEYYKSIRRLTTAVEQARDAGYIGENILGSGYSVSVGIRLGAGSYLCGEELTMLESLEGKRGYPRIKPPFPAEKGLFGFPTLVNNVETLATIPAIITRGAKWYAALGAEDSPGTKIFTLSGDVKNPGYFEVETGTRLRQLIFDLAGGIKNDEKFKAALIGGAAGTFVDETVLDTPMSYDLLKSKGAVLGSGAVIVLSETASLREITRSILEFFKHESCGKCVLCRVGTAHLVQMFQPLAEGIADPEPILAKMIQKAEYMAQTSLCPLGQSPMLPLRSLNRYFSNQL
ncbi:MAG: NADH-quinone oxidoreductase subunit NuoF [Desulfobacterales bacterium]|nr:NADH-quinone oxidoreductase subunit NuoF [Desulfobacterales bacterium]